MLNFKNEGRVEFYLDELGGKPAAIVEVTDRDMIKVVPVLYEVRGKHDIYLLFRGGDEELFDVDWWKFSFTGTRSRSSGY